MRTAKLHVLYPWLILASQSKKIMQKVFLVLKGWEIALNSVITPADTVTKGAHVLEIYICMVQNHVAFLITKKCFSC